MRARNIKPGFYKNEQLAECSFEARLLFPGLWMLADREGRLESRPKKIKAEIFPFDAVDVSLCVSELEKNGLIITYSVNEKVYIQVKNFSKHQMPHHKEVKSVIPAPPGSEQVTRHSYDVSAEVREFVFNRDGYKCLRCGTTEGLSIDHIKPLSDGGDNSISNLQTLCKSCNSSKGATTKDYGSSNVDPTLTQRCGYVDASCPSDILNPESLNLNPESISSTTARAEVGQFSMMNDWKPSEFFPILAATAGVIPPGEEQLQIALQEFVPFWMTKNRKQTAHEWDLTFIKAIKAGFTEPKKRAGKGNQRISPRQQYMEDVGNLLEQIDGATNNGRPSRLGEAVEPLPGERPQLGNNRQIGF